MLLSLLLDKLKEEIAPPQYGLNSDLYGLQFGSELKDRNIQKVAITLDPTKEVIKEAIRKRCTLIISHHGIMHKPKLYINDSILDEIKLLTMNGIDLFVMHTAWDAANGGISETLLRYAGLKQTGYFYFDDKGIPKPIGRIGEPFMENTPIKTIILNLKNNLQLDHIRYNGDLEYIPKKVAIVGGKGFNEETLIKAKKEQCDTIITGELDYPAYLMGNKLGLNLIETTHYKSEKVGMENLKKILSLTFPRDEFFFIEHKDPIHYA